MFQLISQYKGLRKEVYILFLGRLVTNLGAMVYPMLTLILNQKLGMDATGVAILDIITGAVMLPLGMLGGKLADKCNKKNVIVTFDLISIAFFLVCAFLPISFVTVALMILASACQSMEYPSYNALVADLTSTKDRERAFSLEYLGANLGLVAAPTLAGFLFNDYLWLTFLIEGISIGLSTLLIFLFVRNITPVEDNAPEAEYQQVQENESLWSILKKNRVVVLYMLVMAFYWTAYSEYQTLMPLDLARIHGATGATLFGTVSSLNCVVVVIFTPLITKLFVKLEGPKKTLVGVFLLFAGYVVFLLLLGFIPAYYLAITLFTFGEIFTTVADGPYVSSRIPSSHRGRINGALSVVQSVISGIGMLSIGLLYDYHGNVAAWGFVFGLLGIALLGILLLIRLDKLRYPALYTHKTGHNA